MGLFSKKSGKGDGKIVGKYLKKVGTNLDAKKEFQIQIVGVGGAGCNIVNYISKKPLPKYVRVLALNTDNTALAGLDTVPRDNKWVLAKDILKGDGAGGDSLVGFNAAVADKDKITEMLTGTDLLFVVCGFGKGTGTGATSVVAKLAKDMGITTIGVFNLPSYFVEGEKTYNNAISGLANSWDKFDSYVAVSNDKIMQNKAKQNISISQAFETANEYINQVIRQIIDLIVKKHEINVDFADVKNFFKDRKAFIYNDFNIVDYSEKIVKETMKDAVEKSIAEISIFETNRALIRFDLNKKVPSEFMATVREALKDIYKNPDIDITTAVNYSDNVEGADVKILSLGEMNPEILTKMKDRKNKINSENFDVNKMNSKTAKIALNEWHESNESKKEN